MPYCVLNNAYCDITIPIVYMLNKENRREVNGLLSEGYKKLFDIVQTSIKHVQADTIGVLRLVLI